MNAAGRRGHPHRCAGNPGTPEPGPGRRDRIPDNLRTQPCASWKRLWASQAQIDELALLTRQFEIQPLAPNRFRDLAEIAMANNPSFQIPAPRATSPNTKWSASAPGTCPSACGEQPPDQLDSERLQPEVRHQQRRHPGRLPLFAGGSVSASTRQAANQLSQPNMNWTRPPGRDRTGKHPTSHQRRQRRAQRNGGRSATALVTATKKKA